jgi:hypothetical protein
VSRNRSGYRVALPITGTLAAPGIFAFQTLPRINDQPTSLMTDFHWHTQADRRRAAHAAKIPFVS